MYQKIIRLHDAATRALFAVAWLALAVAAAVFVFGVVARYFFNAPTTWSGEVVSYCLAVLIFAALPELTRQNAHIAVDIVPEALRSVTLLFLHASMRLLPPSSVPQPVGSLPNRHSSNLNADL